MDEELKCPSCRKFLREPILLHCAHSYCRECAIRTQVRVATASGSGAHLNTQFSLSPSSSGN